MSAFPIIHCADLERSLRFYRDHLGFTLAYRYPDSGAPEYLYLVRDGSGLGLGRPTSEGHGLPTRTGLPATFSLCLYVPDLDALYAHLIKSEGRGLASPADQPWGERVAWAQDPDGYPLMLIQGAESVPSS